MHLRENRRRGQGILEGISTCMQAVQAIDTVHEQIPIFVPIRTSKQQWQ